MKKNKVKPYIVMSGVVMRFETAELACCFDSLNLNIFRVHKQSSSPSSLLPMHPQALTNLFGAVP